MDSNPHTPNRLIQESSPYLQQHAYNPVDWYPWSQDAFLKAQQEDKPILVSIGYAACHWCHVMERESFEDVAVAEFMNRDFVCIKVDREEYPAVDDIYMEAVQAIAGNGGWPLNCFLTPQGKPFYGGTYFPPVDHSGRPGWMTVLKYISNLYHSEREKVLEQAERLTNHIGSAPAFLKLEAAPPENITARALIQLHQKFDSLRGGFEGAPKFPASFVLRFLLSTLPMDKKNPQVEDMLVTSLNQMASGGLYDQAGGGFHRYTVDAAWRVPHFEKMLYDNSALLILYAEAWGKYQEESWKNLVYQTAEFILREMTDPETGACFAALDADSEGEEGKYYTWTKEALEKILGSETEEFCSRFGCTEQGNWEGVNILYRPNLFSEMNTAQERAWFAKLCSARQNRIPPLTDTKTLTSWNGLMLQAWAQIWKYFPEEEWKSAGIRLGEYLIQTRIQEQGLLHTHTGIPATLEDYAYLIRGLTEGAWLWNCPHWLDRAIELLHEADLLLLDSSDGYYFSAPEHALGLIVRKKDFYDNAQPSGNAVMAENLWMLGRLTDNRGWVRRADQMVSKVASVAVAYPRAFGHWLMVDQLLKGPEPELVCLEEGKLFETFSSIGKTNLNCWFPGLLYFHSGSNYLYPQLRDKQISGGKVIWYSCTEQTCSLPLEGLEEAKKKIIVSY